jgi:hypothetical protein
MILTPHLLVGAAIGQNIQNFWLVFVLAIFFHFLTDAIPHWDYVEDLGGEIKNKFFFFISKASLDFGLGLFFILYFFWSSPFLFYILTGALASVLPDVLVLFHGLLKVFFGKNLSFLIKYQSFHNKFHLFKKVKTSWLGLLIETAFVVFLVFILLK